MSIPGTYENPVLTMGDDVGNTSHVRRDDGQTRRHALEERVRHVVDVRWVQIDVVRIVHARHLAIADVATKRDALKVQLRNLFTKNRRERAGAHDRQRGVRPDTLETMER